MSSHSETPLQRLFTPAVVDVASIACVLGAILAFAWPVNTRIGRDQAPRVQTRDVAPHVAGVADAPVTSDATQRAHVDSMMSRVVNGNVFSASRRAPTSRFQLPGQSPMSDVASLPGYSAPTGSDGVMDSAMAGGSNSEGLPRLSGLVTMNGERRALLQLRAVDGVPSLYRAGDVHAGFRVVRIGADHVVLSSRAGTRTLRLSAPTTPDSLELSR